jgi:hypothetical protein
MEKSEPVKATALEGPIPKDRAYWQEKFKKCMFYWSFLEVTAEIQVEILEELRAIRKQLEKEARK